MIENKIRFTTKQTVSALVLALAITVLITACGGGTSAKPTTASSSAAPAPRAQAASTAQAAGDATSAPQANASAGSQDCVDLAKANIHLGTALAPLVNLTADTDYAALTDPKSIVYVDFVRTRKDLDTLAKLPDPTDATELTFGKPSASVAYFREMMDVAEADVKSQGKPFQDKGADGQKVIGIDTAWGIEFAPFGMALDKACPNFTLPADTPASNQTGLQIGQTGTIGDLKVTLDKVTTTNGTADDVPAAGDRFVFALFTIENMGKTDIRTAAFGQTTFTDGAGNFYPFDNNASATLPMSVGEDMAGQTAAGAKGSGILGYQIHSNAGDLLWTVIDSDGHQAVFQVKASDIVAESMDQSVPGSGATETDIAATTAALIQMGNDADATDAALTASPVTDEPTATDEPTETVESDSGAPTDAPTDVPDAAEPTETPGS